MQAAETQPRTDIHTRRVTHAHAEAKKFINLKALGKLKHANKRLLCKAFREYTLYGWSI